MVAASQPVARLSDGKRPPGLFADRAFRAVTLLAGFSVLLILALIAVSTLHEAWPVFSKEGLHFFTSKTWDVPGRHFGHARVHLRHAARVGDRDRDRGAA